MESILHRPERAVLLRRGMFALLSVMGLAAAAPSMADVVETLVVQRAPVEPSSSPVTQSFSVAAPSGALHAIVILLTGGNGYVGLVPYGPVIPPSEYGDGRFDLNGSGNFLVRSHWLFGGHGLAVITLDSATDFQMLPNGLTDQQANPAHLLDLLQVINWARKAAPGLPVWVVGTSRGTAGAFLAARYAPSAGGPDGLVLASPINVTGDPDSLLAANLDHITVPVLLIGDTLDACALTPPSANASVAKGLTHAPRVGVELVEGSRLTPLTDACNALSGHGFFGVESQAVARIAHWILDGGSR